MGLHFGFPWSHILAVGVRAVLFSELGRNFVADIARCGAHCGSPGRLFRPSDLKARRHRPELGPHVDQMEQHVNTSPGLRFFVGCLSWTSVLEKMRSIT